MGDSYPELEEKQSHIEKVIHSDGCHMVILPEGTRTLDGKLQKFKKGGFHMAINTNTSKSSRGT